MGDRGPATSSVTIVVTVLATVFVAARFFTRIYLVRSIKNDDWWMLAAWLVSVGFSTSICVGVRYGLGKHRSDISDENFVSLRQAQYAFAILYNPSLMLIKTSIITFYISVMSRDVDKVFKWCNWLTLAVVNIGGLAFTFLAIFQCIPVSAGYHYPIPDNAKCTDIVTLYLSSAPVNIITDIAILLLPMPILTGMRLPKKQKIILVFTFSFGAFVAVVDVVRLAYLQNAATDRLHDTQNNTKSSADPGQEDNDFSYDASLSFMWSAVEVHLGIICACVPGLKALFLRFMPSFIKDSGDPDSPTNTKNSIDAGNPQSAGMNDNGNGILSSSDLNALNNPAAFRKPVIKEYAGSDDGDNMGFLNMLASGISPSDPEPVLSPLEKARTNTHASLARTPSNARLTRAPTHATVSDFDFYKMSSTRNMLLLTNAQSIWPIATVTIIFFLWGFAYGLLDQLNAQFQRVVQLTVPQSLGLHAAYFSGYLIGPLTLGRFILKRYGFKASMMTGLCVYGCGTLVFWPSAVLTSYVAFVISNFIVAFGLSCLEIAANPYIALCGPLEYAEVRLNLSQAFQAVGTVCSPLLARKVLFDQVAASPSLLDTQWAYLGIALFVYALAIVFYYIPLPEASDEELAEQAAKRAEAYGAKVGWGRWRWKVVYVTLALGVFSQWLYVGFQEAVGGRLQTLYEELNPTATLGSADFQTVGHTVFAVGRFLAAFLNYLLKPRWILLVLWGALIVLNALQMVVTDGDGSAAVQMLSLFMEAGIFAITYALCMRGLGAHTKTGSAWMSTAISGGAVWPVIQWAASAGSTRNRYSYCVPVAAASFGLLFPIYLNGVGAARRSVDPVHEKRRERRENRKLKRQDSAATTASTATASGQFGIVGILARHHKKTRSVEEPTGTVEHVEQKSESVKSPVVEKEEFVQLHSPQGIVGDLKPWSDIEGMSGSSEDGSSGLGSGGLGAGDVRRHQTRRNPDRNHGQDDEIEIDDYHEFLKS